MHSRAYAITALLLLTALNFLNYMDRFILPPVQTLVQAEIHGSDAQFGLLTSAFIIVYMLTGLFVGPLSDRYSRRMILVTGALLWSVATMLTATAHSYWGLLIPRSLVGIGEATFIIIGPTYIADIFPEARRGRIMGIFYLALPVGAALGFILGGWLGPTHGWRFPFLIGGPPGIALAIALAFLPEPKRGGQDAGRESVQPDGSSASLQRQTLVGLIRNRAYWTATLGMTAMVFAQGALSVWMPTYLSRERGFSVGDAGKVFGVLLAVGGLLSALPGGWLGDKLLPRFKGAHYLVSAVSLLLAAPAILAALYSPEKWLLPSIGIALFLLLLNTAPLNAAVINSVDAPIRGTALAVNLLVIHLFGDAASPTLVGWVSDRWSLGTGFSLMVVAIVVSSGILFYGMRFAPEPSFGDAKSGHSGQSGQSGHSGHSGNEASAG